MTNGANKRNGIYTKGIAWLFLFVFGSLSLAEVLHSHVNYQSSEVSISHSPDEAAINKHQSFCELCDYLIHQSSRVLPVAYHLASIVAKLVYVIEPVQTHFAYSFDDLLLFSGSSPPIV